jgi:hypothetical protein
MAIIRVSRRSEKPMLKTVRMLRLRLRNVFFVTNRVKVMSELQKNRELGTGGGHVPAQTE